MLLRIPVSQKLLSLQPYIFSADNLLQHVVNVFIQCDHSPTIKYMQKYVHCKLPTSSLL